MEEKFKSRKFIVWITATILLLMCLIGYCVVKDSGIMEVAKIMAEGWIWVSALYIGANGISKFATKNIEVKAE